MNQEYLDFINSDEWKEKKKQIIFERGPFCEKCGKGNPKNKLHLHHLDYNYEFGTEKDEDLMLVCENCHKELHQDIEFFPKLNKMMEGGQ